MFKTFQNIRYYIVISYYDLNKKFDYTNYNWMYTWILILEKVEIGNCNITKIYTRVTKIILCSMSIKPFWCVQQGKYKR